MPQPSRSLLPLRVIRATPCAPSPPQRVSRLPLRYVGRPGLLGTARRWSAGSSPPVGLSHRLLNSGLRRAAGAPALNGVEQVAAPTAGQPEFCGARRLAPELRTFERRGCNRGVSGSLRVPALRSRVSARNGNRMRWRAWQRQCVTRKRSLRPGPLRWSRVSSEMSVCWMPSASPPIWKRLRRVVTEAWPC